MVKYSSVTEKRQNREAPMERISSEVKGYDQGEKGGEFKYDHNSSEIAEKINRIKNELKENRMEDFQYKFKTLNVVIQ